MSITDELREWARGLFNVNTRETLLAIAVRIDAEHERTVGFCKRLEDAAAKREDVEIFGVEYTALPLDADGEYIHIGDVMDTEHFGTVEVEGFVHSAVAFYNYSGQPAYICTAPANTCHHHEPTVEDVLREMHAELDEVIALYVGEVIDSDERDRDEARIFAEYSAKLRLAGEDE